MTWRASRVLRVLLPKLIHPGREYHEFSPALWLKYGLKTRSRSYCFQEGSWIRCRGCWNWVSHFYQLLPCLNIHVCVYCRIADSDDDMRSIKSTTRWMHFVYATEFSLLKKNLFKWLVLTLVLPSLGQSQPHSCPMMILWTWKGTSMFCITICIAWHQALLVVLPLAPSTNLNRTRRWRIKICMWYTSTEVMMLIVLFACSVEISSDDDAMSVKSTKSTKRYPITLL